MKQLKYTLLSCLILTAVALSSQAQVNAAPVAVKVDSNKLMAVNRAVITVTTPVNTLGKSLVYTPTSIMSVAVLPSSYNTKWGMGSTPANSIHVTPIPPTTAIGVISGKQGSQFYINTNNNTTVIAKKP